jgi:aminoglycoside 6'-N-acetyltransferase I
MGVGGFPGSQLTFACGRLQAARPVGYIEGWYVSEDQRHRGIGRELLVKAEDWARSHGCVEMASDATIDNQLSQRVHEASGYEVVDRCVHYRKVL